VFVVAASLHGAMGIRTIAIEWLGLRGAAAQVVAAAIAFALCALGLRAVLAVVMAP
jgi:succinate dehydrogenase subunit C